MSAYIEYKAAEQANRRAARAMRIAGDYAAAERFLDMADANANLADMERRAAERAEAERAEAHENETTISEDIKNRHEHYLQAAETARNEAYALAIVFGGTDPLVTELFKKAEKYDEAARLWAAAMKMKYFARLQMMKDAPAAMFV